MQMKNFKEDFPLLRENPVVYLDSAATAQRPESVINSEMEFYKKCNANPLRGLYDLGFKATECYEQSRETVRQFINARSEREIIFTRNATESLNLVAYSYGMNFLKKGDEILVTVMEHHSNQLPWRVVAEKTGAAVTGFFGAYKACGSNSHIKCTRLQNSHKAYHRACKGMRCSCCA